MGVQIYSSEEEQIRANIEKFKNPDAKKWISKWVNEKQLNGVKNKTIITKMYNYQTVLDLLDTPIKEIIRKNNRQAIERLLEKIKTKHNGKIPRAFRVDLKTFFKWVNEDEMPKCVRWVKTKKTLEEHRPEPEVLTDEERSAIIKNAPSLRDRVIFQIMNENPTRPIDILNMKVKDVISDEYGFVIKLHSKTKTGFREVRLINSVPDLRVYLSNHRARDNPEAPLFYAYNTMNSDTPLKYNGLLDALAYAVSKAKIKRKVTLYDFRRTVTAEYLQDPRYTTKEVQVMGGWSDVSTMMNVYGKVTSKMAADRKLIVNNLKPENGIVKTETFRPMKCPRCNYENSSNADTCVKCWLPLTQKAVLEVEEKRKRMDDNMNKLLTDPEVVKMLVDKMERLGVK